MTSFEAGAAIGRYRVLRTLGSGAMGVVYLAQDPQIERLVAIKTVRPGLGGLAGDSADAADRRERLLREARTAGRLIHPHIVTLFDAGEHEGTVYLAMEYVEGTSLGDRLAAGGPVPLAEALRMAREAAAGLAFAHRQGIVHRDVKPANLLLTGDGRLKISDFGIAKVAGQATELTMTGTVVGSPHYLSPEQVRGERLDGRSDLFSLGVVLYELLGAQRPFDGETLTTLVYQILHQEPPPMSLRPGLAPQLTDLLSRLLAKDRDERFRDGEELEAALAALERALPAAVLAAPAVAPEGLEPTRLLPMTGAVPVPPATRPGEAAGETPSTRPAGVPPPPPAPAGAPGEPAAAPGPGTPVAPPGPRHRPRGRLALGAAAALFVALVGAATVVAFRGLPAWLQDRPPEAVASLATSSPEAAGFAGEAGTGPPADARGGETPPDSEAGPAPAGAAAPGEEALPDRGRGPEPAESRRTTATPSPSSEPRPVRPPPAEQPGRADRAESADRADPAGRPAAGRTAETGAPPTERLQPTEPAEPAPKGGSHEETADPDAVPGSGLGSGPGPAGPPGARRLREALEERPALRRAVQDVARELAPDQILETGLAVTLEVQPRESFVLLNGTVVGRATEYAAGGRPYRLPGAGEYLLKLRAPGMRDYRVLLRAREDGPGTTLVRARLDAAPAEELDLGDLPLIRVRDAIGFSVQPATAMVFVDGRPVGRADQYPGRFGRPRTWLPLSPGRHRVSVGAPGFERRDFAVDVSAGAAEVRDRIEVRLTPAGDGP